MEAMPAALRGFSEVGARRSLTRGLRDRLARLSSRFPELWQLFQQSPGDLLVLRRFQQGFEVQERYSGAAKRSGCFSGGEGKVICLPQERGAFAVRGYDANRVQSFDQNEQGLLVKAVGYNVRACVASVPQSRQGAVQRFRCRFR